MKSFINIIRWSLLTNRQYYVTNVGALLIVFFVLMGCFTGMFSGYKFGVNSVVSNSGVDVIVLAWMIASGALAANVCHDLRTKQQRTQYLMLPASNRMKFWTRILIAIFMAFVATFLAFVVADLLQMLVSLVFVQDARSFTVALFEAAREQRLVNLTCSYGPGTALTQTFMPWMATIALAAWSFSSYLLGGFVFRKSPFILTTCCWILFWIIVFMGGAAMVYNLTKHYAEVYGTIEINFLLDERLIELLIPMAAGLIFTVLNLWLSYRTFHRMVIIGGKWTNF